MLDYWTWDIWTYFQDFLAPIVAYQFLLFFYQSSWYFYTMELIQNTFNGHELIFFVKLFDQFHISRDRVLFWKMEAARTCNFAARLSRITGLAIGWLGVLVSVGLIYSICEQPGHFGKSLHETIIAFLPGEFFRSLWVEIHVFCFKAIFTFSHSCTIMLVRKSILVAFFNWTLKNQLITGLNLVASYSWLFGIDRVS